MKLDFFIFILIFLFEDKIESYYHEWMNLYLEVL